MFLPAADFKRQTCCRVHHSPKTKLFKKPDPVTSRPVGAGMFQRFSQQFLTRAVKQSLVVSEMPVVSELQEF